MSLHAALYDSLSSAGSTGLVVWVVSVPGLDDASRASAGAPNDCRAGEGWKSDDAVVCVMHVLLRHLSLVKLDPWHDDRVGKFQCLTQGGGWWRWHTAPLTAKRDHSPRWRIDPALQRTLHHSSRLSVGCHHICCVSTRLHCQHCVHAVMLQGFPLLHQIVVSGSFALGRAASPGGLVVLMEEEECCPQRNKQSVHLLRKPSKPRGRLSSGLDWFFFGPKYNHCFALSVAW